MNKFKTGTLDLTVNGKNGETVVFKYDNIRPGSQPHPIYKLQNICGINGYLDLENITVTSDENEFTEPEIEAGDTSAETGELDDVLNLRMFLDKDGNGWWRTGDVMIFNGKVRDLASSYDLDELMEAGGGTDFILDIYDWWNTEMDNKRRTITWR